MKFLDAEFPQSTAQMVSALEHEQAQSFAYYIGGDFAGNAWPTRLVDEVRAAGYPGMGIYVSVVANRDGYLDGQDAGRLQTLYGGDPLCCWDLEPVIYEQDPAAALAYGVRWVQGVRSAGYFAVLYSVPLACAAIADKGFDFVWPAVPGNFDPASIFNPAFFPGRVAVQAGAGIWDGVEYDVSISEFDFGPATVPVVTPLPGPDVMPREVSFPAVLVGPPPET